MLLLHGPVRGSVEHSDGPIRLIHRLGECQLCDDRRAEDGIDVTVDRRLTQDCECGHSGRAHYDPLRGMDVCRHCTCPEFSLAGPIETVARNIVGRSTGAVVVCEGCSRYFISALVVTTTAPKTSEQASAYVCDDCVTAAVRAHLAAARECPF